MVGTLIGSRNKSITIPRRNPGAADNVMERSDPCRCRQWGEGRGAACSVIRDFLCSQCSAARCVGCSLWHPWTLPCPAADDAESVRHETGGHVRSWHDQDVHSAVTVRFGHSRSANLWECFEVPMDLPRERTPMCFGLPDRFVTILLRGEADVHWNSSGFHQRKCATQWPQKQLFVNTD